MLLRQCSQSSLHASRISHEAVKVKSLLHYSLHFNTEPAAVTRKKPRRPPRKRKRFSFQERFR